MTAPARAAEYQSEWGPSPAISPSASVAGADPQPSSGASAADFSPPLIAMVAVVGAAFLIVLYARVLSRHLRQLRRRWCRRRRLLQSTAVSDLESPHPAGGGGGGALSFGSSSDYFLSPYGLDDEAIRALPLSLFSKAKAKHLASLNRDCAVCLLEFEDEDWLRTLPLCSHAFHVDCIDVWLRSHATCPLCRAAVLRQDSFFIPLRAARIRPSFDDLLLDPPPPPALGDPESEITPAPASAVSPPSIRDRIGGRDFLLKRSYSFGFERSLAADRMVLEASTASPWRYRQRSFWSKRWPSPFAGGGSSSASRAARVFSFRSYRGGNGVKSPFLRRRGFFPLSSESAVRFSGAWASSSRRTRSMTSPSAIFMRPATAMAVGFSSSRMRCGDPEALLSPERFGNRR